MHDTWLTLQYRKKWLKNRLKQKKAATSWGNNFGPPSIYSMGKICEDFSIAERVSEDLRRRRAERERERENTQTEC